jgi:hypothetical protein
MDIGLGHIVRIEQRPPGFHAVFNSFRGQGPSIKTAIYDLFDQIRKYNEASADFLQSTSPGGQLDTKMRALTALVDQIVAKRERRE